MISTQRLNRFMRNHDFKIDKIEIRSPFDGRKTGSFMIYRNDTHRILNIGVPVDYNPADNTTMAEHFLKLSEFMNVRPRVVKTYNEHNTTTITASLGRGRGSLLKYGDIKISKGLYLTNHLDRPKSTMEIIGLNGQGDAAFYPFPSIHTSANINYLPPINANAEAYKSLANVLHEKFKEVDEFYKKLYETSLNPNMVSQIADMTLPKASNASAADVRNSIMENIQGTNALELYTSISTATNNNVVNRLKISKKALDIIVKVLDIS